MRVIAALGGGNLALSPKQTSGATAESEEAPQVTLGRQEAGQQRRGGYLGNPLLLVVVHCIVAHHVFLLLGPKLLLPMGCVKLDEKNCVHLPSVGEQIAN